MSNNIIKELDSKMSTKTKKITLYTTLEVLTLFMLCLVGSCFDWVHLTFTFEKLIQPEYWATTFQTTMMYTCALLCGYFFRLEKLELNNSEYYSLLDLYHELLKSKLDSFVRYIDDVFNPNTKKRYIKANIEKRLLKLDKHTKDSFKIEFSRALKSEDFTFDNYNWSSKKMAKYAKKRLELTKLASQEYINENWEYISIKYPKVSPYSFTTNLRGDSFGLEYKVDNQTAKDMGRVVGRKLLLSFLFAAIIALFIMDPSRNELLEQANGWIVLIIRYIVRFALIIINFIFGLFSAKTVFDDNFILPLQNRNRILGLYINWSHENNEVSFADRILEAYRKQNELSKQLEQQKAELEERIKNVENLTRKE